MSGLFSVFNVANRGMATQQKAIGVTSHNIANANTEGYSRQRATIETTRPFNMPSLNNSVGPGQIGTGAQVSAIERVRDTFLDYQVRVETSRHGQFAARDKFLSEVENIFNEPSETGISTLVGKFFDSWHTLAGNAQSSNSRTIVAQQAAALSDALNHTANQLKSLTKNVDDVMSNTIFEVNDILEQVDQLNQQIIGVKVAGQMPNDLMDRRDLLLDKLSSKFNIKIDKEPFEGVNVSLELASGDSLATTNPLIKAVGNNNETRFSYIDRIEVAKDADGNILKDTDGNDLHNVFYYKLGNTSSSGDQGKITLHLTDTQQQELLSNRVIIAGKDGEAAAVGGATISSYSNIGLVKAKKDDTTGKYIGEIYGYQSVKNDINAYEKQLDKVAKALAFSVNEIHSYKNDGDTATVPDFFVNKDASGLEEDIKASNISVNKVLLDDVMQINAKYSSKYGDTDGSRALAIAELRNKLMNIQKIDSDEDDSIDTRADMFNAAMGNNSIVAANGKMELVSAPNGMKLDSYFKDIIGRLGVHGGEAQRMVKNQETLLSSFQETRESVSGVSLDEEMASLIQYQHAYQANAKIISTVDELLDVVINGLKR
jgi:flagellar hook-associated protein 1 FlgK